MENAIKITKIHEEIRKLIKTDIALLESQKEQIDQKIAGLEMALDTIDFVIYEESRKSK